MLNDADLGLLYCFLVYKAILFITWLNKKSSKSCFDGKSCKVKNRIEAQYKIVFSKIPLV